MPVARVGPGDQPVRPGGGDGGRGQGDGAVQLPVDPEVRAADHDDDHEHDDADDQGDAAPAPPRLAPEPPAPPAAARRRAAVGRGPVGRAVRQVRRRRTRDRPSSRARRVAAAAAVRRTGPRRGTAGAGDRRRLVGPGAPPARAATVPRGAAASAMRSSCRASRPTRARRQAAAPVGTSPSRGPRHSSGIPPPAVGPAAERFRRLRPTQTTVRTGRKVQSPRTSPSRGAGGERRRRPGTRIITHAPARQCTGGRRGLPCLLLPEIWFLPAIPGAVTSDRADDRLVG